MPKGPNPERVHVWVCMGSLSVRAGLAQKCEFCLRFPLRSFGIAQPNPTVTSCSLYQPNPNTNANSNAQRHYNNNSCSFDCHCHCHCHRRRTSLTDSLICLYSEPFIRFRVNKEPFVCPNSVLSRFEPCTGSRVGFGELDG